MVKIAVKRLTEFIVTCLWCHLLPEEQKYEWNAGGKSREKIKSHQWDWTGYWSGKERIHPHSDQIRNCSKRQSFHSFLVWVVCLGCSPGERRVAQKEKKSWNRLDLWRNATECHHPVANHTAIWSAGQQYIKLYCKKKAYYNTYNGSFSCFPISTSHLVLVWNIPSYRPRKYMCTNITRVGQTALSFHFLVP